MTSKERENERKKACVFCFVVICVAMCGYMYEGVFTYHPFNSIIPNPINLIAGRQIIPDEPDMFLSDYYIKPYHNESMNDYINRVPTQYRLDNKMWGGWMYLFMMFIPLFIISVVGARVEKIDKHKIISHLHKSLEVK
jgi:hypothetical protein